jgi:RIO-like serine/threonine protein kinase
MDFSNIIVERSYDGKLQIHNPTNYPLVGKGKHGALFRLAPDVCVKIFADPLDASIEGNIYRRIDGSPIVPRLYATGKNYIVMEFIDGPDFKHLLMDKNRISKGMAHRILNLFSEMKKLGFLRMDVSLRHILVSKEKNLKIIDHYYTFTQFDPHPVKFLKQLNDIGLLDQFIERISTIDLTIYQQWQIDMPQYFKPKEG